MTSINLFENSLQVVTWLRKMAAPMIALDGSRIADTGIASVTVPKRVVDTLLYGGATERTAGKQSVYNFVRDGKAYTLKVNFGWSEMKRITFTWDHRTEEPTPAIETEAFTPEGETEMFKFYYRDLQDRMTLEIQPWEAINNYRMMDGKWQVQKQIGSRWIIIAESKNWHVESVSEKMQRQNNPRPKLSSRLVNGLLVETETKPNETRTRIYFQSTKDNVFSPHLKVYQGTHMSLEGNVTLGNYAGFVKASVLAGTLLKVTEAHA